MRLAIQLNELEEMIYAKIKQELPEAGDSVPKIPNVFTWFRFLKGLTSTDLEVQLGLLLMLWTVTTHFVAHSCCSAGCIGLEPGCMIQLEVGN